MLVSPVPLVQRGEFLEVVVALRFPVSLLCARPSWLAFHVTWFQLEMTVQLYDNLARKHMFKNVLPLISYHHRDMPVLIQHVLVTYHLYAV